MKYYSRSVDKDEHILATYRVEPCSKEVGMMIAAEESTGTWLKVPYETKELVEIRGAKCFRVDKEKSELGVAFPVENFSRTDGIPVLLSAVAGNLFGMSAIENVRLLDLEFPDKFARRYKGPRFGLEGVRKLVGTSGNRRPHVGAIVKPDVGLPPARHASIVYEAAAGGCDFIKDDELLGSPHYSPREDRVPAVMGKIDLVREETGRNVLYAVNITSRADMIVSEAEKAVEAGANCVMVNFVTAGISSVEALSDARLGVPIHCHRDMHAAFTRNPRHGIDYMVLAKLVRLAGGDQLHTGTAAGKMEHEHYRVLSYNNALKKEWHGLRRVFPVASGGISPATVYANINALGRDVVLQAGGGVAAHPAGIREGAMAMKQAVLSYMEGLPLSDARLLYKELDEACRFFGS